MRWPVFVTSEPMERPWRVGDRVAPRLMWWDDLELPPGLGFRDLPAQAHADGDAPGQRLHLDGLTVWRPRAVGSGRVRLTGALTYDRLFQGGDVVPPAPAVVARIRVVRRRYDLGEVNYVPRPDDWRTDDVPEIAPEHLCDSDDGDERDPVDPEPGTMMILSPEQYIALARDWLPEQEWRSEGFVVDLETGVSRG